MRRLRGGEKGGECDLVHPCHGLVMGVPTDGMKIEKDSFFWDRKNLGLSATWYPKFATAPRPPIFYFNLLFTT